MAEDHLGACRQCGERDWYVRGSHKACRQCQRQAVRRYRARQAVGQGVESRASHAPRALSTSLRAPTPAVAVQRRRQTHCHRRHALSGENVRWEVDRHGRSHRVCRACRRDRQRVRYGTDTGSALARMLTSSTGA